MNAAIAPSRAQIWLMACRPKTLPAAIAPVLVGTALAFSDHAFSWGPFLAALLGAGLIQIGTNLANDYFDAVKGADTAERLGPVRVTQAGLASPREVRVATALAFTLAAAVGLYLVAVGGWPIALIGVLSILSGIAYTGGPYPLGYNGLGDVFVFVFFGAVAVLGTYFVQAHNLTPLGAWLSVPIGLLATAILVVNNLRDLETDRKSGKRTLAVRFGERFTRWEYALLVTASYLVPLGLVATRQLSWFGLLPVLSVPLAIKLIRAVNTETGRTLNQRLAGTGQLLLVFGILLSLGVLR
jgi:1,4-dihydroxy-2-naphthoate octaprenyltransferase